MDLSPGTARRPPKREAGKRVRSLAATVERAYYVRHSRDMTDTGHVIRLAFRSSFDLLDVVQLVSDRLTGQAGLDEDAMHWVSVAVRESVINAIKHGNREDATKQ